MFSSKNLLVYIGRNAIGSLLVVAATVGAILFLSSQIERMTDSVALNHRLQAELQKRTSLFELLKHDSQIVGSNDTKIFGAFAPSDNILGFINTLDDLGTKNSLTQIYHFDTPILSSISAPFPISTITYTNSFQTTLPGFSTYLGQFNKLPYYTKIDSFSISSQDKLGWLGQSAITYHATLYANGTQ
jgi:hypothetical protein